MTTLTGPFGHPVSRPCLARRLPLPVDRRETPREEKFTTLDIVDVVEVLPEVRVIDEVGARARPLAVRDNALETQDLVRRVTRVAPVTAANPASPAAITRNGPAVVRVRVFIF
jgi:hypothetical protein